MVGRRRARQRAEERAEAAERRALIGLLEHVVTEEHEIVTMLVGRDASSGVADAAGAWLAEHRPAVTLQVADGGQPLYPYLVGSE